MERREWGGGVVLPMTRKESEHPEVDGERQTGDYDDAKAEYDREAAAASRAIKERKRKGKAIDKELASNEGAKYYEHLRSRGGVGV